jgi:flagellar biosynthesis repressor protein FlbT
MPLKIQLKPNERVIVNGAVIEGSPENRTEIVVMNNASVLRQKHILQQDQADTPCKRMYFTLQMMYIDEDERAKFTPSYKQYFKDLDDTFTLEPIKNSLKMIDACVEKGKFYEAMKLCRELIKVEAELFKISNPMED